MLIRRFFNFVFTFGKTTKYICISKLKSEMKNRTGHSFVLLNLMNRVFTCVALKTEQTLFLLQNVNLKRKRDTDC